VATQEERQRACAVLVLVVLSVPRTRRCSVKYEVQVHYADSKRHAVAKTTDVLWSGRERYCLVHLLSYWPLAVLFGVLQGLVLGPILFLIYVAGLLQLVKRQGLHPHCCPDDTQIYGFCDPSDVDALQERLSVCMMKFSRG